ncbi:MAG: hypothetical protein AB7O47_08910 [Flavobacteriales bacterium]
MLVIILIVAVLLFVVFALRGVGSSYGNGVNENMRSETKINDKNYFL